MELIRFDADHSGVTVTDAMLERAARANELLHTGKGAGNDFLGWVSLPSSIGQKELSDIESVAAKLRGKADTVICIGIGGSYLGAKAVLEAMTDSFESLKRHHDNPTILFAGQNISEDYTHELLAATAERSIAVIVISKSGTTTDNEGYPTFVIPDNVGGRYSVLTPVGLLPLAVAGIDIRALVEGARDMERMCGADRPIAENPAARYAVVRNEIYNSGKKIEILGSYEPKLLYIAEWWKQLYGESEGKEGKGMFPASVTLTADLHSMGQYIQEGERTLFETIVSVAESKHTVRVEADEDNLDGLNFLAGKRISEINRMAELGVRIAHVDGGVPNMRIEIARIDERTIGQLLYFFEKACGISGYLLGVNPFNQPGVEAYKKNMFALLDKPGYEEESKKIKARL